METFIGKVLRENRITIPKNIVEILNLKHSELVRINIERFKK